jgi:hypothetical protein
MSGFDHAAPEALERVLADFRRNIYTSFPARITRYYPDRGTVDVEPAVMRELPGEDHEELAFEDLGELTNLPVQWPRAAGFVITFPLRIGDWVKVHCAMQSLLVWREQGQVHSHPGIDDPLGLNGCWVEPGCYPDRERVRNVSTTDLVIGREDGSTTIKIKPDGTITLGSDQGDQPIALASKVDAEINRIWQLLKVTWIPVAQDGGAALKTAAQTELPQSTAATKVRGV